MSNFAWIKINGYSYICEITNIDHLNKTCDCMIGRTRILDAPFSAFINIRDETLPWEERNESKCQK